MIIYKSITAILRFALRVWYSSPFKGLNYSRNNFAELMGGTNYLNTLQSSDSSNNDGGYLWFHVASVGEVRALSPLISHVRSVHPSVKVVISTITETGKGVALEEYAPDLAFILPVENRRSLARIFRTIDVRGVVIMDTELWPLFVDISSKESDVYLINGRMSPNTAKTYSRVALLFRGCLGKFTEIIVKSEADAQYFLSVNGSIKPQVSFDIKVLQQGGIRLSNDELRTISAIPSTPSWMRPIELYLAKPVFFASSLHLGEEGFVLAELKANRSRYGVLLIAPRHMHFVDKMVASILAEGFAVSTLSDLTAKVSVCADMATDAPMQGLDVIVIDRFGVLGDLYACAHKIIIGGSFLPKHSGHNLYEALALGKRCALGPYHRNFEAFVSIGVRHNLVDVIPGDESSGYTMAGLGEGVPTPSNLEAFGHEMDAVKESTLSTYTNLIHRILKQN